MKSLLKVFGFSLFSTFFILPLYGQQEADSSTIAPTQAIDTSLITPAEEQVIEANSDTTIETGTVDSTATVPANTGNSINNQYISFRRERILLEDKSTVFNILTLKNPTDSPLTGTLRFYTPNGWKVITNVLNTINIAPGDSFLLPIRIALGSNTKGNVANVISASFTANQGIYSSNFYIQVPKNSKWSLSTGQNTIYFNEYFEDVKFDCLLQNTGNTDEMIKLSFETGKLLAVDELPGQGRNAVIYIPLAAGADTTLVYTVRSNEISFDDQDRFEQIWKESTVTIRASTNEYKTKQTIWFKQVENEYDNRLNQRLFPLNVAVQFNNLLSSAQPRSNINLYGTTLLNEGRQIRYQFGALNANLNPDDNVSAIENEQNLIYNATYQDSTKEITVGNLRSSGIMFSGIGRGVSAKYRINKLQHLGASYSRNLFLPIHNYSLQYTTFALKRLSLTAAANYEDNKTNGSDHTLGLLRGSYVLYRGHRLSAGLRGVNSNTNFVLPSDTTFTQQDTSLADFGYEIGYSLNKEKIRSQWRYYDYTNIETKGGGIQFLSGSVFYFLKNGSRIHGLYNRQFQDLNRFPGKIYTEGNYILVNEIGRLTYGKNISRSVFYEIGPLYNYFRRETPPSRFLQNEFASRTYSIFASMRFQLGTFSSISPFLSYGFTFIESSDAELSAVNEIIDKPATSLRLGVNFRDRYWGIATFYSNGPVNFFEAQSFANEGVRSQVLNIRPSYQRSFYQKKLRLNAYLNYITRAPSLRENTTFSTRLDYHPNNLWNIYATTNVFNSAYMDEEQGRISNRSFNIIAGIRKSFDIQHPRTKVYDLTIVAFNDVNGNQIMDPTDQPLGNILTEIEAIEYQQSKEINRFRQMEFVSDLDGMVRYYGIAMGSYKLKFIPMESLVDLYNINGIEQTVMVNSNMTYYVPFGESYKILGKIDLLRDKFTSEGTIDVGGVRVTATGPNKEVYSVLTDNFGNYVLYVPQADFYTVSVANVFGERFEVENESYTIHFAGFKNYKLDFKFVEKKREIKIDGDYNFNLERE